MKQRYAFLSILSILIISACSIFQIGSSGQQDVITGSGKSVTETRPVGSFSAISVTGNATLIVEQGETPSLTITADDNILPLLESRVRGDQLILGPKDRTILDSRVEIEYRVTAVDLEGLKANGNIGIQAMGVNTESLTVEMDGNTNARLAGTATLQEVTLNGNSFFESPELVGREGKFKLDGNSQAVVNVSDRLDADLSGNSILEYIGGPQITQKVDGSSQLVQH